MNRRMRAGRKRWAASLPPDTARDDAGDIRTDVSGAVAARLDMLNRLGWRRLAGEGANARQIYARDTRTADPKTAPGTTCSEALSGGPSLSSPNPLRNASPPP